MNIKLNIEWLLEKKNKNLNWLSKETRINYNALFKMKKWETVKVEFNSIWKLLEAFKCKPNDLFKITK